MFGTFCNMGWGYGFGWVFMLLFWGLIIWAIVYLIQNVAKGDKTYHSEREGKSIEILKERYAKGELSKEEFEKMRKDLQ